MKILTLNTWQEIGPWQERWKVTFEGIDRLRPDIVAFQELFNPSWASEVKKRTGFSHLIFPKENGGLTLYTNYPVKTWGIVQLTQSPLEDYFRFVLWAQLQINGNRLFVFVTHFSWMLEDGATRKKQVEEALALIQEKAPKAESLFMGDLNAPPDSPEIQALIERGHFRDLFLEKHAHEKGYSWDNRNPYVAGASHLLPDRRIDFILARGSGPLLKNLISCDLVLTQPDARGIWASDHFGMLAEFE